MVEAAQDPVVEALVAAEAGEAGRWLRGVLAEGAVLSCDSRAIRAGDAFFAMPGLRTDGRRFIADALAQGAAAIVVEQTGDGLPDTGEVPVRAVERLGELAGQIASEFHGRPSEQMQVIAVTGTNGKTSTTQWLAQGLESMGRRSAVIGTLGNGPLDGLESNGMTTPDALQTQALLSSFAANRVEAVAMEASSIGLHQGRMNGTRIRVAAYTNLTRDHLDYHGTMQAYAAAKASLFGWPGLEVAVVNGDDEHAPRMLAAASARDVVPLRVVYGFAPSQFGARGDAVLMAERLQESPEGASFVLSGDFGRAEIRTSLLGGFNVSNALAVAGCWLGMGISFEQVVAAIGSLRPAPGRMQVVQRAGAPLAVVDYAHSPDALASVITALRPVVEARGGELWCVFGAGGERDPGKRPMMGRAVERGADRLVVTSDNPRGESPFRIVSDIRAGLSREPALTQLDRRVAIETALQAAAPQDVVLIAGKGHENYQEIAGVRHPFSDVAIAEQALEARTAGGADV